MSREAGVTQTQRGESWSQTPFAFTTTPPLPRPMRRSCLAEPPTCKSPARSAPFPLTPPADPPPRHIHPHHKILPPEFQTTPAGRAAAAAAHDPPPAIPFATATDLTLASTLPLPHSGARIPVLGLGVWASPAHTTAATVATALQAGYRHVDTAQAYGNEAAVGTGLRNAGVPRAEVFVTTKIRTYSGDAEADYRRCVESVAKIDPGEQGYVDLFLVHVAAVGAEGRRGLWGVMERLVREGRARSVGVSNWTGKHIEEIREGASVWPPQVNQLEVCWLRELLAWRLIW